jgi:prophage maintenance system killer protein
MTTTIKTIEIDSELLKTIEIIAKKENTTEQDLINDVLKKEFINVEKENVPDFFELGGKFTADEPFSAVEDLKKMRNGEL